jgi:hypothetical protein
MHQQSARPAPSAATFLRPADVAAILQVSPKTVTRWAKEGKPASCRTLGGHRRYAPGRHRVPGGTARGQSPA